MNQAQKQGSKNAKRNKEVPTMQAKKDVGGRRWLGRVRAGLVWSLSACLAFNMLGLTSTARAANALQDQPPALITDMYFDATDVDLESGATKFVQGSPSQAISDSDKVTKPDLTNTSIQNELRNNAKIKQVITQETGEANPNITDVEWDPHGLTGDQPEMVTNNNVSISGDEFRPVETADNAWTFSVYKDSYTPGERTVTVGIKGGSFECTYTPSAGGENTLDIFVEDLFQSADQINAGAGDITLEATYKVTLQKTAQEQDKDTITAAILKSISPMYAKTTNLFNSPTGTIEKAQKGDWQISADDADYANKLGLSLVNSSNTLSLTIDPTAMQEAKSLNLTFSVEHGYNFAAGVSFAATNKKPVTFKYENELECRPESEQVQFFSEMLNNKNAWNDGGTGQAFLDADIPQDGILCNNVSLAYENAPEDPTAGDLTANVSYSLVGVLASSYELANSPAQIKVKAAGSIAAKDIQGSSLNLIDKNGNATPLNTSDPQDVKWVNWEHVYTQWNGYGIIGNKAANSILPAWNDPNAYSSDGAPMNDAQGEYTDQTILVKDQTGVIKKVTGITYRLDRTAPTLESFSVDESTLASEYPWASWIFGQKATVTIIASDKYADTAADGSATNDFQRKVSGLSDHVADDKVEYEDKHSGSGVEVRGFETTNDDKTAGRFQFDIDGDQQADVNSFKAYVTDNAGNTNDGDLSEAKQIPSWVMNLAIDSMHPELSVSFDNNDVHHGSYYNKNRTATFVVTMATFKYLKEYKGDDPVITIYQGDKNAGYGTCLQFTVKDFEELPDLGQDKWAASYTFSQDADYKVLGSVTSLAGATASFEPELFTIDKTAPVLNVTYDNNNVRNGKYYNASRIATVTIVEHNFDPSLINLQVSSTETNGVPAGAYAISGWSNSGDLHTATVSFPQDGTYQIQEISGTDLADNAMATYGDSAFVIDTQKPTIALSVNGEADAASHAYKDGAPLAISLNDTNIDPASTIEVVPVGLNSSANPYASSAAADATHVEYSCENPAPVAENDNLYRATIHAVDLAGNEDTKTCEWSVNRFGSVYTVNQETKDMLDKQYVKSSNAGDVTIIEINPSGIDESTAAVNISNGANNNDLQKDSGFQLTRSDWDNLPAYNYLIPKTNYASDGTYQITVQSHDLAGNASSNTMENKNLDRTNSQAVTFAVDNTAPVVSFSGFNDYEVPEPTHDITIKVEDNIALDKAVVKTSDGSETTLSADDFDPTSHNATITLHETGGPQQVEVEAYDKAGNMNPEYSPSIVVSTNPFVLWANNPVVVAITVVILGCAIAAGAYFVRRKKQLAED